MIWLLRHGRTPANAKGLLLGRNDPVLDEQGLQQAEALAAALSKRDVAPERVVSSPLLRCHMTASIVADALGIPVDVDERWIELDYGEMDGVAVSSLTPEMLANWQGDPNWAPAGGESLAHLGQRVRDALEDLEAEARAAAPEGQPQGLPDMVVVSHVSPIKAAVAWALGVGDEIASRLFLRPASITRISLARNQRCLVSYNITDHLP